MQRNASMATIAGLMLAASAAFAQGAAGAGSAGASAPGAQGTGTVGAPGSPGAGPARTPDESNTPGWRSMSQGERGTHQQRLQSFRTYEECRAYMGQHTERMRARPDTPGSTAGVAAPGPGGMQSDPTARGNDVCAHLPRT